MPALTSVVLVLTTLALGLGVGTVATNLMPSLPALQKRVQDHPAVFVQDSGVLAVGLHGVSPDRVQVPMMPLERDGEPASAPFPLSSATGPWKSPLYPQNGVTLWDRVRVSSQKDRRAFLIGAAIQIHAPALAATPGTDPN